MQPFDHQPELGPLRPKQQVLPRVIRRGTTLRRRRRVLIAAPPAAASLALVAVVALLASSTSNQHVRITPVAPPSTSTTVRNPRPSDGNGAGGAPSSTGPGGNPAGSAPDSSASVDSNSAEGASSSPPNGHVFGPCLPAGTQQNNTGDPRACYDASSGPKGNYTSTDSNARGCVVHNTGAYTVVPTPSDFFCQYDAVVAGGYSANGPFNLLRIVRNGQTIDYDGMDPSTPRCEPTGFVQPGDHVYIDGRNDFTPGGVVNPNGYTTASVGDTFHC